MAIDDWFDHPEKWQADAYLHELSLMHHRPYTEAFFDHVPGAEAQQYETSQSAGLGHNAGMVTEITPEQLRFDVRCKLRKGMVLEFLLPGLIHPVNVTLEQFADAKTGQPLDEVSPGSPGQAILIPLSSVPLEHRQKIVPLTIARKTVAHECSERSSL